MYVVTAYIPVNTKKHGTTWLRLVISISFVRHNPPETPISVDAVNYDTAFPYMSAILFFLANRKLILALEADDSIKQIFFPTFAREAIAKKY